jgi:glycosyltransferase involved in cell wall biosynthesis
MFGDAGAIETDEWPLPKVVVDGVFFQLGTTGIARVWRSLLEEWSRTGFVRNLVLLDRGHTAPPVPGLRTRSLPRYDPHRAGRDASLLQNVCDEETADLFISTYYTAPLTTPSVHLAYDLIPEMRGSDLNASLWKEKRLAILHASAYLAISDSTARDLVQCFPHIPSDAVTVAYPGVSPRFSPARADEVATFTMRHGIKAPYFLIVGERVGSDGYKNTALFFEAFSRLPGGERFAVVCTGGQPKLEPSLTRLTRGRSVYQLRLADAELRSAYSGAIALVYPSLYEGFGLPIAEAMACGCPVITCRTSSIPEVAGDSALYVGESDVIGMMTALETVQRPEVRQQLAEAGLRRVSAFTWPRMAKTVAETLVRTATRLRDGSLAKPAPLWAEFRDLQSAHARSSAYFLDRAGRLLRRIRRGLLARSSLMWERSKAALSSRKAG